MGNNTSSRICLRILPKLSRTSRRRLEALIARYRERCGVPRRAVVEVTVADDALLAELNRKYRRREGPTDVLAFPIGRDPVEPEEMWLWGEVYVSVDRAREQAERRGVALDEELAALVAHGLLHLAGYDDDGDEARAEMERAANDLTAEAG
ncbi:MAG TPA: rRNA maturation RNase YbeY [bacterium]|nr:rRNA maturation RNase YbeY [bacterium]